MSYTQEETEALEKVDKYKGQLYPVGEDRAAMCHASVVLAAALRSREALLAKKDLALMGVRDNTGRHLMDDDTPKQIRDMILHVHNIACLALTPSPSEARP